MKCQVIILAAGKGVRMRSALPKVLHRLCGQTLVHRAIRAAAGLKPDSIAVVVGYGEAQVREELSRLEKEPFLNGIPLRVVVQAEQLGTGHAVQMALPEISGEANVLIMPGDCPLISTADLQRLQREHQSTNSKLSFLTADFEDPAGLGRVIRNEKGAVVGIIERKDCSAEQLRIKEINSSIYIFEPELLKLGLASLKATNAQKEYYLTDTVDFAVKRADRVEAVRIENSEAVLGANDRAELSALESNRRAALNGKWMEQGVTLEDPAATYIEEDVQIGADSYIGAGTRLRGRTVVGPNVVIDGNSVITDAQIGAGTRIKFSCVIDSSEIGEACEIGPFAHVRPGSKFHGKVKIGNFVETKKTEMKAGAKANHLTYLGDATVGEKSNIGAGTITCNYDGTNKHRTDIGSSSFVGSNSCLVAPVNIGNDAYIGAGSTITKDVPDGALAVGRARQENKEGWMARKKASKGKG